MHCLPKGNTSVFLGRPTSAHSWTLSSTKPAPRNILQGKWPRPSFSLSQSDESIPSLSSLSQGATSTVTQKLWILPGEGRMWKAESTADKEGVKTQGTSLYSHPWSCLELQEPPVAPTKFRNMESLPWMKQMKALKPGPCQVQFWMAPVISQLIMNPVIGKGVHQQDLLGRNHVRPN